jgi:signal peptidase II
MFKKNLYSFLIILLIFLLDRLSKEIIINLATPIGEYYLRVNSFLNLNLIWNEGIAFGLFSFDQNIYYNLITIIIILITIILLWLMVKSSKIEKVGFSMVIGGSIGNFSDRIYYSAVPDFIDINYNGFHWFVFNVADIFITLGVLILIYCEIFLKEKI